MSDMRIDARRPGQLARLRAEAESWLALWKSAGKPTLMATTPCCHNQLELPVPVDSRRTEESRTLCPHCGAAVVRVVTRNHVSMRRARAGEQGLLL